jgi:hypothetical protein
VTYDGRREAEGEGQAEERGPEVPLIVPLYERIRYLFEPETSASPPAFLALADRSFEPIAAADAEDASGYRCAAEAADRPSGSVVCPPGWRLGRRSGAARLIDGSDPARSLDADAAHRLAINGEQGFRVIRVVEACDAKLPWTNAG